MSISQIDYLTVSLGHCKIAAGVTTEYVLNEFASILPEEYRNTCRDIVSYEGRSMRVNQFGISVSLQYGSAVKRGWVYSVQLSGVYWEAINRDRVALMSVIEKFTNYRVSRLDLEMTALVPLAEWRDYCKSAFDAEQSIIGAAEAMTVCYGSRLSQMYTRIYCKSSEDPTHYPATADKVQVRLELEIKHIKGGDFVLDRAFQDSEFADRLFLQRVRQIKDGTGFIKRYFDSGNVFEKLETVKRTIGDFESTVRYVFQTYEPYILAGLKSEVIRSKLNNKSGLCSKTKRILAVLEQCGNVKRDSKVGEENEQQKGD